MNMKKQRRNTEKPEKPELGGLKKISVFYVRDMNHERTVIYRTVLVNMSTFIAAIPALYDYGFGKETVVKQNPMTVEYDQKIPRDTWLTVYFANGVRFDMLNDDFKRDFEMDPPENFIPPF